MKPCLIILLLTMQGMVSVAGVHLLVLPGDGWVYFGYTGRICRELGRPLLLLVALGHSLVRVGALLHYICVPFDEILNSFELSIL